MARADSVRDGSPVVALHGDFDLSLVTGLRDQLPPDAEVIVTSGEVGDAIDYVVTWTEDLDAPQIENASSLRGLVQLDSGAGSLPLESLKQRDIIIEVVSSPALISVAEHAVMLILAVFKRFGTALDRTRAKEVVPGVVPKLTDQEDYSYNWVGLERFEAVKGKTIGLVGLGKIGREVALMLRAFSADVVYHKRTRLDPAEESELDVRFLDFDDLLSVSDCVSLHNRFNEETEKMMAAREFALMPEGSFFVNTARGRLVDEGALCDALANGHLAGAALDVFWYEPPQDESPLWRAPNLIMTPHTAGIPIAVSLEQELAQAAAFISADWIQGRNQAGTK